MRTELQKTGASCSFGFTLIEATVAIFVAGLAILVTMLMAGSMTDQMRGHQLGITAQDNARVAMDEITRILRAAGSGTDYASGQPRFVYADANTVVLNANLLPLDDPRGTATPQALDPALDSASVPLGDGTSYTPPRRFGTGAETIVLTLDSNRDGTTSDSDADDDEEEESANPRDFVLKSFVYGNDGAQNTLTSAGLALLRGPTADDDGNAPEPLFRYWIDTDNDASTEPLLHGDLDADGQLSSSEVAALTAVPSDALAKVERIDVTATAESDRPHRGSHYRSTVLRSSVSFRNRTSTSARIVGKVFHDVDSNGRQDAGEIALRDVTVRCSNGSKAKTDAEGRYSIVVRPGVYSVTEVDPAGYASTTPNIVSVNPGPGEYVVVDFGDVSRTGTGYIRGRVYEDANRDGVRQSEERGIAGIRVFLDTGASTFTSASGRYEFAVSVQDYTVTEEDSTNYVSSTPNVVEVNLTTAGDSVIVDYGDYRVNVTGRIHGIVYHDQDNDGIRDTAESGLANVTLTLGNGESTVTDTRGEFRFTVEPGSHAVTEVDPPGFTSSTVNTVNVTVVADTTVEVRFGDIGQEDITFQEIVLGNTERALSIASLDLGEDNKSDIDIVLGTHYVGGKNDLLAWWNARVNSSTPNAALFPTTPSHQRLVDADVNGLAPYDLDGDGRGDLISVLGGPANNIAVWLTQGSGNSKGQLPTSPTVRYTASLAQKVNDVVLGQFDGDPRQDFAIVTTTGGSSGNLEIWRGSGGSSFSRSSNDLYTTIPGFTAGFGETVCIATADFDANGKGDLVIGARISPTASMVYLLIYDTGTVPGRSFALQTAIPVQGQVTDVRALDLFEDDQADVDILVSTEISTLAGRVEVWHNRGNNTFGFGDTPSIIPNDVAEIAGVPLSLATARVDNDVFPDLFVGTRSGTAYAGQVLLFRAYGYLPTTGTVISTNGVGEVITLTAGDLNKDGTPDIATGTRTSSTTGKVVIYFTQRPAI